MAVYTTYEIKPKYYSGAVSGCLNGGADYRTVEAGKVVQDVNLLADLQMQGLSNACTITNFKANFGYRLTNTSNGSGLTLKGDFFWVPLVVTNPVISGDSIGLKDDGMYPLNSFYFHDANGLIQFADKKAGSTSYTSYSYESSGQLRGLGKNNALIGGHFAFRSQNSTVSCRMWLNNVTFTVTRTRACFVFFDFGDPIGKGQFEFDYGTIPSYPGDLSSIEEYREGYHVAGWRAADGTVYTGDLPAVGEVDVTYTAVWELNDYSVNFRNLDGSIFKTLTRKYGDIIGNEIPTPTRAGYEFAGWLPCKPAKDLYGNVFDSRYYGGLTSYPLAQDYKYTNKFTLHIEAHKTNWGDIKPRDNKQGEQIISCTEGGGWGLGYPAGNDTSGRGAEIYSSSGYKIIDFGFENFVNNSWYAFDLVFNSGTFEAYVNGEKKGSVSIGTSTLAYNSSNTIFVGAEAGGNTESPAGNYFYGTISNVFIANQGEKLAKPSSTLVVYNQIDYYPIWRKLPTYKAEFLNYDNSLLQLNYYSQGTTPTYTGSTPTRPSDDDYEYEFSGWNPKLGSITNDTTYIAQFKGIKNKYNLFVSTQGGGQSDKEGVTQNIDYGTEITITATPDVGYRFVEWGDGNSENPRTFKLKGDTFLYPIFEKDFFSVELIDGQVDLVVSGQEKEGKYEYYSELKISPIEKPGYKFTHWTGEVEEFQGEYFIRVFPNMKIVANYQELEMVFKSVKIYYPTENDLITPKKFIPAGERAQIVIQVALE